MNRREALLTTMAATLIRPINPTTISYAGACEVAAGSRLLFISGQVPERPDGSVPEDFTAQCRLTWANIERQLRDAGMSLDNLVKVTTFLSDRRYRGENSSVRREVLKERTPAITIVVADIYDEAWLLEIEAIAAA
jgi:enamine deaminase RidA (YjgF/YER057c/UK114 family)